MQTFKNFVYFALGAATIIAILMLTSYTGPDSPSSNTFFAGFGPSGQDIAPKPDSFNQPSQEVYAPKMPSTVNFAGEPLPMDNFDARERFDRELIANCFRHSATFLFFKKANRYFPIIEPILAEYDIPDDIKYLAVAESALSNAISPAGAKGFWQFMPSAAKERGLEVGTEVDERYHLEKSILTGFVDNL